MNRLYELIAREHDLRLLTSALLAAGAGSYAAQNLLAWRVAARRRRTALFLSAAAALAVGSWLAATLAVQGAFPFLTPATGFGSVAASIGVSTAGALLALTVAVRGRPGYRDPLLAGAVLACSVACLVFLSLDSVTRPYRLAYGLGPVTATVMAAAALNGLGLGQIRHARGRWQVLQGASCLAAAQLLQVGGGLASILGFADWLAEADKPASLATEPVFVIVAASALVTLALSVVGSAVDHRLALQADREADRWRQLADSALEGILIHSGETVLDANAAFCAMVDTSLAALRGRPISDLFRLATGQRPPWDLSEPGASTAQQETALRAADGDAIPVEVVPRRITYKNRCAQVLAIRDLRERREAEARIRFLAHHDGLTGLANRVLFNERIELALGLADRSTGTVPVTVTVTVLCLDLDRFKAVNDSLGHAAGDLLLRQVAARLATATRATDTVARVGGDEFIIMQTGVRQPQAAAILATRLIEALCAPFDLDGKAASIGVSIGIALYRHDGSGVAELLRHADTALYRAKTDGRGAYRFYEPAMDAQLRERQALERDLRAAIGSGQFAMRYQPVLACASGEVAGFEALMRWNHPTKGAIDAAAFMPPAEEAGLIGVLGAWALEAACEAASGWPPSVRVAVGLSPARLRGGGLAAVVARALERTGLPASRLELELTEGALARDPADALAALDALRALGVGIVLDDFGVGHSGLGTLHRFPFTRLKIDRSFMAALAGEGRDDGRDHAIVPAILAMSRSLGIDVVAAGVETAAQLALLRAHGCGAVQGALVGGPMPADDVPGFLQDRAPSPRGASGHGRHALTKPFAVGMLASPVKDAIAGS